jgi:hypothetical protein
VGEGDDVDITPNYMREDREGGLDALGTGFPGIRREDLMLLPEGDWLTLSSRLTYEGWVRAVKAETSRGTE